MSGWQIELSLRRRAKREASLLGAGTIVLRRARQAASSVRLAYLPVLVTYFCYGASAITAIALVFFEKDTLSLTPAEAASVAFWVGLPWSMKMVAGVAASDRYPILRSRRASYLTLGALGSLAGYAALATTVDTKPIICWRACWSQPVSWCRTQWPTR